MSAQLSFDEKTMPLRPKLAQTQAIPSYIRGHRKRLRERFALGGADAIPDYELLELILFRAMPQKDVKPMARSLLEQFGCFSQVIAAPTQRLKEVSGIGDAAVCELKIIEAAMHRLAKSQVMRRHVISSWDDLLSYCRTVMAYRETEQFRVLFLDAKNHLIADEALAEGTVDHVPVYPREIIKRALELNASALILVHNHPSGDPTPSDSDVSMTKLIGEAARSLSITLHDHLIIGKKSETSFRASGLL